MYPGGEARPRTRVCPLMDSDQVPEFSFISQEPNPKGRWVDAWESAAGTARAAALTPSLLSSPGCLLQDGLCSSSETCVNGKCVGQVCIHPAGLGRACHMGQTFGVGSSPQHS